MKFKKVIALLLALVLTLGIVPFAAFAEEEAQVPEAAISEYETEVEVSKSSDPEIVPEPEAKVEDAFVEEDIANGEELYFTRGGDSNNAMCYETAKRRGWFVNSTVADPMFKDAENFDFELKDDSPAFKNGFNRIDYSKVGTKSGSKIGVSLEGGKTPYNAGSVRQSYTPASEKYHY